MRERCPHTDENCVFLIALKKANGQKKETLEEQLCDPCLQIRKNNPFLGSTYEKLLGNRGNPEIT